MARKRLSKAEKVVKNTLITALHVVERKRGFPQINPVIGHIYSKDTESQHTDYGTVYPYVVIVGVDKYPTEKQMDWFEKWNTELINYHDSALRIKSVFFDESGDLFYVFAGAVVK